MSEPGAGRLEILYGTAEGQWALLIHEAGAFVSPPAVGYLVLLGTVGELLIRLRVQHREGWVRPPKEPGKHRRPRFQQEAAERLGCTQQTISLAMRGHRVLLSYAGLAELARWVHEPPPAAPTDG